jgi:hypothetical protein
LRLCKRFEAYYLYWWIKTYLPFAERHRHIAALLRPIEALGYLIVAGWLSIIDMITGPVVLEKRIKKSRKMKRAVNAV